MQLEDLLEAYPKTVNLRDNARFVIRPLKRGDEKAFHALFTKIPEVERLLFKHQVTDLKVIRSWCRDIDYGRILPLLAFDGTKVVAVASLHQQLAGWKRHIGRISVVVHPDYRGRGIAANLVRELTSLARNIGLDRLEAEFMGEQRGARHVFATLGFSELMYVTDYVKDMRAITHDYVLMGRPLKTDEEFTGAN